MINGAHCIVYSKDPAADREFFRDVIGMPQVDVGEGWLIFGLPPSEVAVHPSEDGGKHELYLMCHDIAAFVEAIRARGITCTDSEDQGWGVLTTVTLPGGGELGVYEPRHDRPAPMMVTVRKGDKKAKKKDKKAKKAAKKAAKKDKKPAKAKKKDAKASAKKKGAKKAKSKKPAKKRS